MNKEVNIEIVKLLKEKGFDFPRKASQNDYQGEKPTIVEVVMWLYEKHNIWVKTDVISINQVIKFYSSYYEIRNGFTHMPIQLDGNFNSPSEAYSKAILHTLKNLI